MKRVVAGMMSRTFPLLLFTFLLGIFPAGAVQAQGGGARRSDPDRSICNCEFCGGDQPAWASSWQSKVDESFLSPTKGGPLYPPVGEAHLRNDSTILVLLSGLQDPRCAGTIANVFTRAKHPERMRVGMVDQKAPESNYDCVATYCGVMKLRGFKECPYLDQIETIRLDASLSRGPAWARAGGASFVDTEKHDFCLQADAHSDFLDSFDVVLPRMWGQTGNEYAVLSTYVNQINDVGNGASPGQITRDGRWNAMPNYEIPILCGIERMGDFHRNDQARAASCLSRPLLGTTWGAGLSFAKCHFETRVPNDPHYAGVFNGEEFSRMVRAWTHGYDVYSPHRAAVFHDYGNPTFHTGAWGGATKFQSGLAEKRYALLMKGNEPGAFFEVEAEKEKRPANDVAQGAGGEKVALEKEHDRLASSLGYYGLGDKRTLQQFQEFSGIDLQAQGAQPQNKDRCASFKYVGYDREPEVIRKAPVPPAITGLRVRPTKGSDRSAWPKLQDPPLPPDEAESFTTRERTELPPNQGISTKVFLQELGAEIPPHRTARSPTSGSRSSSSPSSSLLAMSNRKRLIRKGEDHQQPSATAARFHSSVSHRGSTRSVGKHVVRERRKTRGGPAAAGL